MSVSVDSGMDGVIGMRLDRLDGLVALVWSVPFEAYGSVAPFDRREVWISTECAVTLNWAVDTENRDQAPQVHAITDRGVKVYMDRAKSAGHNVNVVDLWRSMCAFQTGEVLEAAIADLEKRVPVAPREVETP